MNLRIEPRRYTSTEIARLVPCSVYHGRKFADSGDLKTAKDHNGWHIFPDPEEAVRTLRRLLALEEPESTQRE